MTDKEIIEDINYRIRNNAIIKKLEEEVMDGIHDDNPLIELVLYYKRDIDQLEEENERLLNTIKEKKEEKPTKEDDRKLTDEQEAMLIDLIRKIGSMTDEEYKKVFNGGIKIPL